VRDATTKEPIAAVLLRITRPFAETSTGPDGVYRFRDLKPGTFTMSLLKDGYGARHLLETRIGADVRTLDIELDRAATLHLRVTDRSGSPVVGRLYLGVIGRGDKTTDFGAGVVADAQGHAVYRQIVPGSYDLIVSQGGVGEAKVETEIAAGENVVRVRLE